MKILEMELMSFDEGTELLRNPQAVGRSRLPALIACTTPEQLMEIYDALDEFRSTSRRVVILALMADSV